jgi:hypothetical protein
MQEVPPPFPRSQALLGTALARSSASQPYWSDDPDGYRTCDRWITNTIVGAHPAFSHPEAVDISFDAWRRGGENSRESKQSFVELRSQAELGTEGKIEDRLLPCAALYVNVTRPPNRPAGRASRLLARPRASPCTCDPVLRPAARTSRRTTVRRPRCASRGRRCFSSSRFWRFR